MSITPIQGSKNLARPSSPPTRAITPRGLGAVPDRIAPSKEEPSSLFKMFLFDPVVAAIRWILRGIFFAIDAIRKWAIGENPLAPPPSERNDFMKQLRSTPTPEEFLLQFERVFSREEKSRVYRIVGESFPDRISWKELLWKRTDKENIELGRKMIQKEPILLREVIDLNQF